MSEENIAVEEVTVEEVLPPPTEKTWLDKVFEERNALVTKIDALIEFTGTEKYSSLSEPAQLLLQSQLSVMVAYSQILVLRGITQNSTPINGENNEG